MLADLPEKFAVFFWIAQVSGPPALRILVQHTQRLQIPHDPGPLSLIQLPVPGHEHSKLCDLVNDIPWELISPVSCLR